MGAQSTTGGFREGTAKLGEQRAKGWPKAKRTRFTKEEKKLHRTVIERLVRDLGMPAVRTIQSMLSKGFPDAKPPLPPIHLRRSYIEKVIAKIVEQWNAESEKFKGLGKESQVRRLMALRTKAENAKDFRTVGFCEREIAKLQGNYAPLRIEAEVVQTQAMRVVIGQLKDEHLLEQMARAAKMFEDQQRLKLLEAQGKVVDMQPEPATVMRKRA